MPVFSFDHNCIQNLQEMLAYWGSESACDGFRQFETETVSVRHVLLEKS